MKILKNLFLFKKQKIKNKKKFNQVIVDQYIEIGKLVKEARLQQNLSIKELSLISKIPEKAINSIEENNSKLRPKYPFIRSILIKLEQCLMLKKNTLLVLIRNESKTFEKDNEDFVVSKFDLLNTWQGSLFYFLILILTIFVLKRSFISNVHIIEIQNVENKSLENN